LSVETMERKTGSAVLAVVFVHSPQDKKVPGLLGTNGAMLLGVNGKVVYQASSKMAFFSVPNEMRTGVTLKEGWNNVMLRLSGSGRRPHELYLRLLDEKLRFGTAPEK